MFTPSSQAKSHAIHAIRVCNSRSCYGVAVPGSNIVPIAKMKRTLQRRKKARYALIEERKPAKTRHHISRTALARWWNRKSSPSEKRKIEWHFLFCPMCQRQITIKELADIAVVAKKRLTAAVRSAGRN